MPGTRINGLPIITGAASASDDNLVIFDASTLLTKRITRAELATGMQADNPLLNIADGVIAPATQAGRAIIYVDDADGDLKVKFGDGTVKTIATDT